jgi:hypothetical protein
MCRLSGNSGASTSWNPKGLSKPVTGKLYLFYLYTDWAIPAHHLYCTWYTLTLKVCVSWNVEATTVFHVIYKNEHSYFLPPPVTERCCSIRQDGRWCVLLPADCKIPAGLYSSFFHFGDETSGQTGFIFLPLCKDLLLAALCVSSSRCLAWYTKTCKTYFAINFQTLICHRAG